MSHMYKHSVAKITHALHLFPDVAIGYRVPGDVVITDVRGDWTDSAWLDTWRKLCNQMTDPMWVEVYAGDPDAAVVLTPEFAYVGKSVAKDGYITSWWFRNARMPETAWSPHQLATRVHPLVHPAQYYGVSTLDVSYAPLQAIATQTDVSVDDILDTFGPQLRVVGDVVRVRDVHILENTLASTAYVANTQSPQLHVYIPMSSDQSMSVHMDKGESWRTYALSGPQVWVIDPRWPHLFENTTEQLASYLVVEVAITPSLLSRLSPAK